MRWYSIFVVRKFLVTVDFSVPVLRPRRNSVLVCLVPKSSVVVESFDSDPWKTIRIVWVGRVGVTKLYLLSFSAFAGLRLLKLESRGVSFIVMVELPP